MKSFLKYSIASFAFILLTGTSCQKGTDIEKESLNTPPTLNNTKKGKPVKDKPEPPTGTEVGDLNYGGIIFWVDPVDETRGLVCALSDIKPEGNRKSKVIGAPWGCMDELIPGDFNIFDWGGGKQNTDLILANCTNEGTAADLCDNFVVDGYSDWYLPNMGELTEMITKLHYNRGIGNFTSLAKGNIVAGYWSSVQIDAESADSFIIFLGDNWVRPKAVIWCVRPVRKFGDWTN